MNCFQNKETLEIEDLCGQIKPDKCKKTKPHLNAMS